MLETLVANFRLFLLIFARLAALFEVAPLFSSEAIPQPARLGFALFATVLALPWIAASGYPLPASTGQYLLLVAGEALVGLAMGFFLNLIFAVFQAAGQYFSLQIGFGASEVFDPLAEIEVPLMGQFLNVVGMLTFLVVAGAQKLVLVGVYRSFQAMRAVDLVVGRGLLAREMIASIGRLFADALTLSFPILGTLLLVSVAMGLLAKAAPQMNLLLMGFPFSIGVAFLIMVLAMPFLVGAISRVVDGGFEALSRPPGPPGPRRPGGGAVSPWGDNPLWRRASPLLRHRLSLPLPGPFAVHLQWFAAEDEGRTEEPTEHKLRKAREEGKVARSVELASALVLLLGIATVAVVAGYFLKNTTQMLRYFFQIAGSGRLSGEVTQAFYSYFLRLVAPVLVVTFVAAFLGNVLQVGFLFSVKPITPDVNRILPNLGRFFRRALFSGEAAFNLAKNILKIAVVLVIAYLNVRGELSRILRLGDASWQHGFRLISAISLRIILESAIAMLVLAVPDYLFVRRQHLESLKMSRQEIKEERRMYEGDPLVRSRLREKMRELLTRNMLKAVPRADVVITNPTHYSVAVEWNRLLMAAPTVTAKGVDAVAMKIREVALEAKVPLVENKPLARTLYHEVEIGEAVPERYYQVMAVILAEVYRLSSKAAI